MTTNGANGARAEALGALAGFCHRILPGVLRRIATWKGVSLARLRDCREDLVQELALDCIRAPAEVLALSRTARHGRWMRAVERWVYRQLVRPARRARAQGLEQLASPPDPAGAGGPDLPPGIVLLKNGRCSLSATARRLGIDRRAARAALDAIAVRLGHDRHAGRHWRRRLAEALTGLAADLLLGEGAVHSLPTGQAHPHPEARLRRIRRLTTRFAFHDTDASVRRIVARWKKVRRPDEVQPALPLAHAVALAPERPEGWLWLFEAAIADGDLGAAGRALRRCRGCADQHRGRIVLARARLLEVRGRWPRALALLRRARRRWPHDPWLRRAWQAVSGC